MGRKRISAGIKGEQIPLISRIISVAETYDRAINRGNLPTEERKRTALEVIQSRAGAQLDPEIVELFVGILKNET